LAFETKVKIDTISNEPTIKDDLAARNLKKCGRCSEECEIKLNFCPFCNFKFEKKVEPPQTEPIKKPDES
jgi:hypothetical protein